MLDQQDDGFVIKAKWILDGASTLEEVAEMARLYAEYVETLIAQGYELRSPVVDDYGYAVPKESVQLS